MEVNEIYQKTTVATKWSSITEIASKLISPIVNMILARLLSPEVFGIVATITMITSFADIFTDAGFQKYLVQHDFKNQKELDNHTNVAFWSNLILSVFLWVIIAIFNNPLAELVGNAGLGHVIVIAALSLPLTSFSSIQMARYKRDFNFKSLFFTRLFVLLVPFTITIPIAIVTRNYWSLIIGTLSTNLLNAILLTCKSKWKPHLYYSFKIFKEMFKYSWWILLESIATWLTSYIGTFIVGIALSDYYLGLYKTSMSTINQIFSLISAATSMPLFVALSRLKDNKDNLIKTYRSYIQAVAVFVIPLGVGVWLYRDFITNILLGNQWAEAANFIGLWGLMSSFSLVLGTYCNGLFNATGKTYLSFLAQILHLIVLIPILIWSSEKGYETLYISRSLIRIELIVVELLIMMFVLKFPICKLIYDIIPIILSTSFMIFVDYFVNDVFSFFFWDIISILICIIAYFVSLFIFSKKALINCLNTFGLKSIIKKE